ncbi:hypothetical protein RND71_040290 [Anisodus tanguticus]|uniref:Pre-mRNA-splicing helicase BRR2-like plug domain-containing protein n=1 Tax=Anisodus tanguticus TaxID=243964 RepID=A0AAE1UNR9_9SOLA|nr:hypothetical protein RND71_040290 [Anisodus tanguticus]
MERYAFWSLFEVGFNERGRIRDSLSLSSWSNSTPCHLKSEVTKRVERQNNYLQRPFAKRHLTPEDTLPATPVLPNPVLDLAASIRRIAKVSKKKKTSKPPKSPMSFLNRKRTPEAGGTLGVKNTTTAEEVGLPDSKKPYPRKPPCLPPALCHHLLNKCPSLSNMTMKQQMRNRWRRGKRLQLLPMKPNLRDKIAEQNLRRKKFLFILCSDKQLDKIQINPEDLNINSHAEAMSDVGGGGAEAHERFKQYDYRANASLVLTTDSHPRDTHEPSGEPESLFGRIDPRSFGDRVSRGRPLELDEKIHRARKKKKQLDSESTRPSKKRRPSVLTSTEKGDNEPKTKETRASYEAMLSMIQQQLGGQPINIVCGVADEILDVLKNDNFKNPDKKNKIEKLLNPISIQVFEKLVSVDKLITDYHQGDGDVTVDDEALDDDVGVAVEFEENEEDGESDLNVVPEDEDEDDDVVQANGASTIQMGGGNQAAVWCTRLARAEDQEKRKKIEEEILGLGPNHAVILEQLHATRATAKERQNNLEKIIRAEARRLKDETIADGDVKR